MITPPTQQIVCSIISRQLIADLSPTSRQPVADQLAINRPLVADRSPIFRDSCRRPVADWSATEKRSFWSHSGCIGCSCFSVARQSPTGCSTCVTGALLAICVGNSPVPGEFPAQRPVTRRPNKRLSKQPWGWWFETPSWSLWRQCNGYNNIPWDMKPHHCLCYSCPGPLRSQDIYLRFMNFNYQWHLRVRKYQVQVVYLTYLAT